MFVLSNSHLTQNSPLFLISTDKVPGIFVAFGKEKRDRKERKKEQPRIFVIYLFIILLQLVAAETRV